MSAVPYVQDNYLPFILELDELQLLRQTRQRVSQCVSCVCFFPCLLPNLARVCTVSFCPDALKSIQRCWTIGIENGFKPETNCDLFCQAIGPDLCMAAMCCHKAPKFEYLKGPERQRMEDLLASD